MKRRLRSLAVRLMKPALLGVHDRLDRLERRIERMARPVEKYEKEMGYWRWLKTPEGEKEINGKFEEVFWVWQRRRLLELGLRLGLGSEAALDAWCEGQSVVEIGAGPYPAVAAAPAWRRAIAVDPLAKGYASEGLLPASCAGVIYIAATGEDVPLASEIADLVILENALDHVVDPERVVAEARRLLRPGGLLWLLVDLAAHSDDMHPHPFDEARIRRLLASGGFETIFDRVSDHVSHPKAYGEYRALLRKAGGETGTRRGAEERARPLQSSSSEVR